MMKDDDYLWDRSGKPDPDVERLEKLLGGMRYDRPAPPVPTAAPRHRRNIYYVGMAVTALAAAIALVLWRRAGERPRPGTLPVRAEGPSWKAQIGEQQTRLVVGEWLEPEAPTKLTVADIGTVVVEPGSRVRIAGTGAKEHRMELAHGTIHASVDAPPRLFVVETAAATAVDLGCAYTLSVDAEGNGFLDVSSGYVALERGVHAAFVPRGARASLRAGRGAGTPYFRDAPAKFVEALARFDEGDGAALDAVLAEARGRDTLTLWHLIQRTDGPVRARVFERTFALTRSLPPGVTPDAIQSLEPEALESWRDDMVGHW